MLSIAAAVALSLNVTFAAAAPEVGLQGTSASASPVLPAPAIQDRGGQGWLGRLDRDSVEKRNPLAPLTWAFYAGPAFPGPRGERRPRLSAKAFVTLLSLVVLNAVILGICLAAITRAAPLALYFPVMAAVVLALSVGVSVLAARRARRTRRKSPPRIAWPSGFSSSS